MSLNLYYGACLCRFLIAPYPSSLRALISTYFYLRAYLVCVAHEFGKPHERLEVYAANSYDTEKKSFSAQAHESNYDVYECADR